MSTFRSPLTVWRPEKYFSSVRNNAKDYPPLDTTRCQAETARGGGWHIQWQQCKNKEKVSRTFASGELLPCCGVHAALYDKEFHKHEMLEARAKGNEQLFARCQKLTSQGVECHPTDTKTKTSVTIGIDLLESLVRSMGERGKWK